MMDTAPGQRSSATPGISARHPVIQQTDAHQVLRALTRPEVIGTLIGLLAALLFVLGSRRSTLEASLDFDEAYNLMLARHLSRTGQYAVEITGAKLRWFDPAVTTGPTVLVPQALGLLTSSALIETPRLIMLIYLAVFSVALYLAACGIGGRLGGALAMVILLWAAWNPYELGLRVLGEVPALAFLCLGLASLTRAGSRSCFIGGMCLGLALLTKPQMMIAIAVLLLLVGLWHYRCDQHCESFTSYALMGVAVPILIWLSIQLLVLGPSGFYTFIQEVLLRSVSEAYLGSFAGSKALLSHPIIVSLVIPFTVILYYVWTRLAHRITNNVSFALRILFVLSILSPLPFLKYTMFIDRLMSLWNEYTFQIFIGIAGLSLGIIFAIARNNRWLAFVSVSGILFAEWSLGISQVYLIRFTIYWKILGLLSFSVVGAALLRYLGALVADYVRRWPLAWSRVGRSASLLAGVGGAAILVSHSLPLIERPADRDEGASEKTARWVADNTPRDALLVGDGWWIPWTVAYLANRDVGDVRTSSFSRLADLRRPMYLTMDSSLLGKGLLLPSTEALLRRDDLRLFQNGTYTVVQWPRSPVVQALAAVQNTDLNIIEEIEAGHAMFSPAPRGGVLDHLHGQFIFPSPVELGKGITMIAPASLSARSFRVQPTSQLFLGFTPPETGDGLRLTVSVQSDSGNGPSSLWEKDIAPGGAYELHLIPLEPLRNNVVELTFSVSSPSGDASADWLQVSPLIVGS